METSLAPGIRTSRILTGHTARNRRNRLGNNMSTHELKGQVELDGIIYKWSYQYHIALTGSSKTTRTVIYAVMR
ncbi:hypothetical protein NXS19_000034 [Fusarium pseudograminearum]|nr:hypothetical protein NXS19_000034 [Fusarium pseudograminearum]